jgi:hypothetical protein
LGRVNLNKFMKVEITKIKLQLKGRDIELTADEARSVREELNKLFADAEPAKIIKEYISVPYPRYSLPIVIDRGPWWPNRWEVTCGTRDNSGTVCMARSCAPSVAANVNGLNAMLLR